MDLSEKDLLFLNQCALNEPLKVLVTEQHRIRKYAALLLSSLECLTHVAIPNNLREDIVFAAGIHDIGKLLIPVSILNKPDKLTQEEYEVVKQHTTGGSILVSALPDLRNSEAYPYAYDVCLHHHERWNGTGYPEGVKGQCISEWAQIVALADVYDALVTARSYKPAYSHEEAVRMIRNGECGIFSPLMLACLCSTNEELKQIHNTV